MFDGLEYQFAGTCTYTLAENTEQGWHVEMTVKNCDYWTTCRKVGLSMYQTKGSHLYFIYSFHMDWQLRTAQLTHYR